MLTIITFIVVLIIALLFLVLGLAYEDAFFGIGAGVILIFLGGSMFVVGVSEHTGTNTTIDTSYNITELAGEEENTTQITGTDNAYKEDIKTYSANKDANIALVFIILGLSIILKGVFLERP